MQPMKRFYLREHGALGVPTRWIEFNNSDQFFQWLAQNASWEWMPPINCRLAEPIVIPKPQ